MSIRRLLVDDLRKILGGREPYGFVQGFYGGSRETVDPPPTDTDCDVFILVRHLLDFNNLLPEDWYSNIDDYRDLADTFCTYRKGDYNLLVFEDPTEFGAVLGATAVAKSRNILSKEERYTLFETARSPWR